jgi:hypothetical protein
MSLLSQIRCSAIQVQDRCVKNKTQASLSFLLFEAPWPNEIYKSCVV